jgi:hypothetical protein
VGRRFVVFGALAANTALENEDDDEYEDEIVL